MEGHFSQDPLADAIADGITFESTQHRWLAHHLANALTPVRCGTAEQREAGVKRCLAILDAVREQVRPPYPARFTPICLVCGERSNDLGPGYICPACSDEEVLP